jgi:hypothetical protein
MAIGAHEITNERQANRESFRHGSLPTPLEKILNNIIMRVYKWRKYNKSIYKMLNRSIERQIMQEREKIMIQ